MNPADLAIIGLVAAMIALAVVSLVNNRRKGCNCCGCKAGACGNCPKSIIKLDPESKD